MGATASNTRGRNHSSRRRRRRPPRYTSRSRSNEQRYYSSWDPTYCSECDSPPPPHQERRPARRTRSEVSRAYQPLLRDSIDPPRHPRPRPKESQGRVRKVLCEGSLQRRQTVTLQHPQAPHCPHPRPRTHPRPGSVWRL